MSEPKLTEWLDGRIKPTLPGVYQRLYASADAQVAQYARWDGSQWYKSQITPEHANAVTVVTDFPHLLWRGLAEPPR